MMQYAYEGIDFQTKERLLKHITQTNLKFELFLDSFMSQFEFENVTYIIDITAFYLGYIAVIKYVEDKRTRPTEIDLVYYSTEEILDKFKHSNLYGYKQKMIELFQKEKLRKLSEAI